MIGQFAEDESEGILKRFGFAFGVVLLCYALMYGCDRHLRLKNGPWYLNFSRESDGFHYQIKVLAKTRRSDRSTKCVHLLSHCSLQPPPRRHIHTRNGTLGEGEVNLETLACCRRTYLFYNQSSFYILYLISERYVSCFSPSPSQLNSSWREYNPPSKL